MITHLGNLKADGQLEVVRRASRLLNEHGGLALFVDDAGDARACTHLDPLFHIEIGARKDSMVGLYRSLPATSAVPRSLFNQMDADVSHHVMGRLAAKRAAERARVAA